MLPSGSGSPSGRGPQTPLGEHPAGEHGRLVEHAARTPPSVSSNSHSTPSVSRRSSSSPTCRARRRGRRRLSRLVVERWAGTRPVVDANRLTHLPLSRLMPMCMSGRTISTGAAGILGPDLLHGVAIAFSSSIHTTVPVSSDSFHYAHARQTVDTARQTSFHGDRARTRRCYDDRRPQPSIASNVHAARRHVDSQFTRRAHPPRGGTWRPGQLCGPVDAGSVRPGCALRSRCRPGERARCVAARLSIAAFSQPVADASAPQHLVVRERV